MKKELKSFRVIDTATGLFSTGGIEPHWSPTGKTWSSEGALKSHLSLWQDMGYSKPKRQVPSTWQVVVFTYSYTDRSEYPAKDRPAKK